MKKILLSVIGVSLFAFPLISSANGVLCTVTVPLNPVIIFGAATAFEATCTNNTSNRNYTDFGVINNSSSVTTTTSCGSNLPVGGSCVISGVFTPTSASDNSFTLGLFYGGTNYPSYPSLSFSTTVNTINFTSTSGPYGGDITIHAYARIPGGNNGLYYAVGSNNDVGQSDIYLFDGTSFIATNFPLTTATATDFSASNIMAADSLANLYAGAVINGTPTAADAVWRFDFAAQTWASTNFNQATMGDVKDLTVNKDDRVFVSTLNGGSTQVWEYDPIAVTWVNTNFPSTIASFQFNGKPTYLVVDHSGGLLYAMTATTVYRYTPSPTPGVGVWLDTLASAVPFASLSALFVASGDQLYAAGTVGVTYDIYYYTPPTTWASTQFASDTSGLSVPLYPSLIDAGSGDILTSGVIVGVPDVIQVWRLEHPTTWTQTLSFPANQGAISFETINTDTVYAASFNATTGVMSLLQYDSPSNTWGQLNFPISSNNTAINLMAVNADDDVFALMVNGSYKLPVGSGTWVEANTGLYALTNRYQEILNGTLFTLNGRQAQSPSCSTSGGDPNSVYDGDWSDFPGRNGFIDAFKNPLGTWANTSFPYTTGPSYLYTPLVSNQNDLYGLVVTTPGPHDVYHYGASWVSTDFATQTSGATVYLCMQGALVTDLNSNVYAVTHSGTTYTVWKYTAATDIWAATTGIPAATLVLQLTVDPAGNPYAIVGTGVYRYNGSTWSSTSFPGLAGSPKHLSVDASNNVYAVTNSLQVWKYTAATATWGSAMLGGTGIPATAGKIYRQLLADSASNLYARTRNTTTDIDSVWKYTASSNTWSDLSSATGFPTGAIIQDLTMDQSDNVFLSTAQGLYVYSGTSWFQLSTLYTDRFLTNGAGNYYQVSNNQGVFMGSLT